MSSSDQAKSISTDQSSSIASAFSTHSASESESRQRQEQTYRNEQHSSALVSSSSGSAHLDETNSVDATSSPIKEESHQSREGLQKSDSALSISESASSGKKSGSEITSESLKNLISSIAQESNEREKITGTDDSVRRSLNHSSNFEKETAEELKANVVVDMPSTSTTHHPAFITWDKDPFIRLPRPAILVAKKMNSASGSSGGLSISNAHQSSSISEASERLSTSTSTDHHTNLLSGPSGDGLVSTG
ncbi:unnamed protein product [Anisakis simplex]|uniref:Uncharacterized protein n=1 Tax=Anisakis simplex TaxID=6269 RepID=A0A3P6PCB6_ANISI|nr:unnamed protein product [Anisakis simplex]